VLELLRNLDRHLLADDAGTAKEFLLIADIERHRIVHMHRIEPNDVAPPESQDIANRYADMTDLCDNGDLHRGELFLQNIEVLGSRASSHRRVPELRRKLGDDGLDSHVGD